MRPHAAVRRTGPAPPRGGHLQPVPGRSGGTGAAGVTGAGRCARREHLPGPLSARPTERPGSCPSTPRRGAPNCDRTFRRAEWAVGHRPKARPRRPARAVRRCVIGGGCRRGVPGRVRHLGFWSWHSSSLRGACGPRGRPRARRASGVPKPGSREAQVRGSVDAGRRRNWASGRRRAFERGWPLRRLRRSSDHGRGPRVGRQARFSACRPRHPGRYGGPLRSGAQPRRWPLLLGPSPSELATSSGPKRGLRAKPVASDLPGACLSWAERRSFLCSATP